MPAVDPQVRRFTRAGVQRYEAAQILLKAERGLDAMYLGGYAVECAMKALVLDRTLPAKRQAVLAEDFRGRRGHDYGELVGMLADRGVRLPLPVARALRRTTWSTDLRYETRRIPARDAEAFLSAALEIIQWVERSLS